MTDRNRSQSPRPPGRSARSPVRPPRQSHDLQVTTRPLNAPTGFTEAFNTKQIKDIIVVVGHGSSSLEQFSKETKKRCKTVFDTIFGCELGQSVYFFMSSTHDVCKAIFAPPVTTDGSKLIERLNHMSLNEFLPWAIRDSAATLTFKSMNEPVTEMYLFQPGFYGSDPKIEDGIFHFSMSSHPPNTDCQVEALNIADRFFVRQTPVMQRNVNGQWFTESNSYTTRFNEDIKLSHIIGPHGALAQSFNPTTTAVIILACRNLQFKNYEDIALQSPSPAPSSVCLSPWLSPAPSCLSPAPGSWLSEFSPAPSYVGDGCLSPASGYVGDGCLSPASGSVGDGCLSPAPSYVGDGGLSPAPSYVEPDIEDVWRWSPSPIPDWLKDESSGGTKRNSKTRRGGGRHKKWIKRKTPLCCKKTIRRKKRH